MEAGVYSKGGVYSRGAFILKSEILGGRSFEGGFIRGGAFVRGNTVFPILKLNFEEVNISMRKTIVSPDSRKMYKSFGT